MFVWIYIFFFVSSEQWRRDHGWCDDGGGGDGVTSTGGVDDKGSCSSDCSCSESSCLYAEAAEVPCPVPVARK